MSVRLMSVGLMSVRLMSVRRDLVELSGIEPLTSTMPL